MDPAQYRLNPSLDAEQLAQAFRGEGRLHIPDFLVAEDAERVLCRIDRQQRLDPVDEPGRPAVPDRPRPAGGFDRRETSEGRRSGLCSGPERVPFRYESIKAPLTNSERAAKPCALNAFARFLSSEETLSFLAQVTGATGIGFADAQATGYGPGHFLTAHDDDAHDQDRASLTSST